MTSLNSDISEINAPAATAFAYLSNMNNWQSLMPEQVSKWESAEANCSFVLAGMAHIGMRIEELQSHSLIRIQSEGKSPFPFELRVKLAETGTSTCTVQLFFEGDMNTMMRMMAEKPLGNFFNYLSHKMRGIH
ncbi:MAG: SRPBCC family protein [Bacteroidia bacterium]